MRIDECALDELIVELVTQNLVDRNGVAKGRTSGPEGATGLHRVTARVA